MNQNEWVLKYLKKNGSITPREADDGYGIMRLASRICELRKEGYNIRSENIYNKKTKRHHARYTLEE